MSENTLRMHRVLRTTPTKLFRAFTEPGALAKWLPPNGFYCVVHELDPRVGGKHRASFVNMTTGHSHSFGGEYIEIVANERLVYTDRFDDPNLPGEMRVTIEIEPVSVGVALQVVQAGIPSVIPLAACYLGWQESMANLARLVEPDVPE